MAPIAYQKLCEHLNANSYRWLVTGAAGFVGSHLIETLLNFKQSVVGLDNFSTGTQSNIDQVLVNFTKEQQKLFHLIEADIQDYSACRHALKDVDFVLHQAALGSVPRSLKDPLSTHASNVNGFINIIMAAKEANVKRFIYASSSSVYGDSLLLPKQENHIGQLLSPYAVTKMTNELYARVFTHSYQFQTIGLRYFNVFGPRQNPNGPYAAVIPRWVEALLSEAPVIIYGDGETTRDFCYINNVVQANLLAAFTEYPDAIGNVYNIAVGEKISLNDLFKEIAKLLGKPKVVPHYGEFRLGDIRHSLADISLARNLLGYSPTHTVREGLAEAMQWYKQDH